MSKKEFLGQLRKKLSGLPREDVEERLNFYSEIIEDRMEEGLSEEEAVSAIGSVNEIVAQAVAEIPFVKIAKERIKSKRRLSGREIVLLVLGSPIWIAVGIAMFAIILSLYISLWAVIISLWATFCSLACCSAGGVLSCITFIANGNGASGLAMLAVCFICAGLAIFMFYGCKATTKGALTFTYKMVIWIKNCFVRKEAA